MSRDEHPIMAALRRLHPSERLLNGRCAGFEEALELVEEQFAYERAILLRAQPAAEDVRQWDEAQAQVRAATRHAGHVYREEQEAARLRTVQRLRADALAAEAEAEAEAEAQGVPLDDEAARWLGCLADALDSGDYAALAI